MRVSATLWGDEAVVRVRGGELGRAELARFCSSAMGSASELEYHLLLAKDLALINVKDHEELALRATELKRMLTALLQKLNADR
jgi:four helix bundle protein